MNLSARINSKYKPNYVLNVNINIPIRQTNLESHRPVSGEFTFSPSQRSKKLKLQIPSARTTNQCESRKISYLGQTQNTIPYRNNNRKRTVKSAFPSEQISQLFNATKKSKSSYRSQALSPNRKKMGSKMVKLTSGNQISNKKQFINDLMNQSEDNLIGYTNQSDQFQRINYLSSINKTKQQNPLNVQKNYSMKKKPESPIIEQQKYIITEIRQFEKSAQQKKQHLNYEYLKQKVLVLASVKKIQRAWRNYKTKKLIKSYSNNISLKFTGKMKNQLSSRQDPDQIKILTVRSCGYNGKTNQFKKHGKKNLSNYFPKDQNIEQQIQESEIKNTKIIEQYVRKQQKSNKKNRNKESTGKSAIVKFQMQQIQRWEQLIKHIRQGKRVDQVLQKSFKRKQQLQKQLFNNLKDLTSSENSQLSVKKIQQPPSFAPQFSAQQSPQYPSPLNALKQQKHPSVQNQVLEQQEKHPQLFISSQISVSSQNDLPNKTLIQSPSILKRQQKQKPINLSNPNIQQEQQQGTTTQKRRKKLQYFQNELRRIDNEYSQGNLSQSFHSQLQMQVSSPQNVPFSASEQLNDQKQESLKLKRKLQALNRIQMFNQQRVSSKQSQQDKQSTFLYTSLYNNQQKNNGRQKIKQKQKQQRDGKEILIKFDYKQSPQEVQQEENKQFFPLSISRKNQQKQKSKQRKTQQISQFDDKLDTFRKKQTFQINNFNLYQVFQNQKWKQLKKLKLSSQQKYELYQKVQQQILYDLLLQFSQKQQFITKMEILFGQKKKQLQPQKPQGICTNLQSIKDYLQNFVAFTFQQQPSILIQGFNKPRAPSPLQFLEVLRKNKSAKDVDLHLPVLSIELFNKHWDYASQQIYFDAKYPNDENKQGQRVRHLKSITKIYFRAIFDGFNQSLQPYRIYSLEGKPYPWQLNIKKKVTNLQLQEIKPLIRLGYRKLSQIAVIYCGLLFEDKKHNMSQKMVQQIQKQRLDTLVQLQLQDSQFKWVGNSTQRAEILFKVSQHIKQLIFNQFCKELQLI